MSAYIFRRIIATIPVMGVVAIFVFLLLHLTPGDPATVIAGDYASPADVERIREQLGLNEPLHVQFIEWVGRLFHGDLGTSIFSQLPVSHLIAQRIEPTIALALTTIIFAVAIAVPLGVLAAWKSGTWVDRVIMIFAVLGFSVPIFVIAYSMIWGFSIKLHWFPVQGYKSIFKDGFIPFIRHITLPTVALGFFYIALIARITRASVMEILTEDYIRTAHSKGLASKVVLLRHALKNASVPIVTIIGIGIGLLLGGVVVTESVFNIPGLGRLTVDSILRRDYPIIQGMILFFSGIYVVINLLVDISYTFLDPRIRY
ncbi:MAG: ABC transporter permease [SAR324 cluster bacterium]|jgi:peptide/nickel transport system permease protein|nr:ABC transporter permease [SAR324 cluster bacterium]MDP7333247.1 ABC transporter permease [SAR324 cluster bacterium]MDP7499833.1 ABC transporter permease [SAR324 cluster bacterium]|tara:strand:- start:541 stop:1485 length:945 start_codon:yes stop_codon:yes gene_type:complete